MDRGSDKTGHTDHPDLLQGGRDGDPVNKKSLAPSGFRRDQMISRNDILKMDDTALSGYCKLEFYKDSGPGGQKRNKSSSAVRVTLPGWKISASDCTERSQSRNRTNALRKLRMTLAMTCRETPAVPPDDMTCSTNNPMYPLWLAKLLDVYYENAFDLRKTAESVNVSPTAFVKKLYRDPSVWQLVKNELSSRSLPLLHPPK